MSPRLRLLVALLGLAFLAPHVRALPHTLEDMDSINFALGVERFDLAAHRPHPPGYPVYVALGKISTSTLGVIVPSWDRDRRAAVGLALWGVIGGTLAAFVFTRFWMLLGLEPWLAFCATALTLVSPLFWFTAARPLTDTPALVGSIWIQTLLIGGLGMIRTSTSARLPGAWIWGALCAGLLIGMRSQTMWLTGPLLMWCAVELLSRRRWRDAAIVLGAAAIGALLWAVPLVWMTGGLSRYLALLGSQGAADFQGVEMLATSPTLRLLKAALFRTFVWPWVAPPLAYALIAAALAGLVRLGSRRDRALTTLLLCYVPYLVFHLAYQESVTLRYALPFVVPVAGLAVIGLAELRSRLAMASAVALAAVTSLVIVQPRLAAYSHEGSAVFRGFQDMVKTLPSMPDRPVLLTHHQVWWGVQRELDWFRPVWDMGPQPFPGNREWLTLVGEWRGGALRPAWFLADVSRTDIALFDWRSRTLRGAYDLDPDVRALMHGPRLEDMDWWEIRRPGWMLGRGWALTPEVAGVTVGDGASPNQRPAEAFLLRRSSPARILIGGRYLAPAGSGDAILAAEIDGRPLAEWRVTSDHPWFTQWIYLQPPAGAPTDGYAVLSVRVSADGPARNAPVVGLEQFDAARVDDANSAITAFSDGWHEPEADPRTGRLWRWTSERSALTMQGVMHDMTLTIAGESPLKYFDRAPIVIVRSGERELLRFEPSSDFVQQVSVPATALSAAGGQITIETSRTFVPAERGQGQDRRKLGLRLSRVDVR